jgi:hypothetical protein
MHRVNQDLTGSHCNTLFKLRVELNCYFMKLLAILLLSIASIAVFASVVLLAATLMLGLGIDVPDGWARRGILYVFLHPWLSLASGLLLLVVFGRGIWRLAH